MKVYRSRRRTYTVLQLSNICAAVRAILITQDRPDLDAVAKIFASMLDGFISQIHAFLVFSFAILDPRASFRRKSAKAENNESQNCHATIHSEGE